MYGNGSSFFVPITLTNNSAGGPPQATVSLTLNGVSGNFILDTGSLGLVASPSYYQPGSDPILAPYATITYSTSGANPVGSLYLTNVQINGANGQSVTARVPILGATDPGYHQLGIGFDRGGIMIGQSSTSTLSSANNYYNMNPFLSLVSGTNVNVSTMQPGYIIQMSGANPGITLGLNSTDTSGFAFQQLATGGQNQSWYSVNGVAVPVQWNSQTASVSITTGGQTYVLTSLGALPDSGISYMLVNSPGNNVPVVPGNCSAGASATSCLQTGAVVQVLLPGQTQAAYTFIVGDPSPAPYGVQVTGDSPPFTNLGRTFFQYVNYLYDPVNGFVGFQNAAITPMLALQGNLTLPNGFLSTLPVFLMSDLTVQQIGSGALNGSIGEGATPTSLTLQSGNLTLGGANTYTGGTVVNGGLLTIANTGSIVGDVTVNKNGSLTNNGTIGGNGLLTIYAGGTFINNGTVDTPLQWQLNEGTFINSGSFNSSGLANTGTATNNGTLTGSVINGNLGTFNNTGTITGSVSNMGVFANNGTVGGSFSNMGLLSGTGTIGGDLINSGVLAPGNSSIGTMTVSGGFTNTVGATYLTDVNGQGQSGRISITGTANLQGGQVIATALPGQPYAYSTKYTILSAAGGVTGTFAGVSSSPFLQPILSYDANDAYLTLQIGGFAAAAQTPTQAAVGRTLDVLTPTATGDLATVIGTLAGLTAAQGQAAMTAISGQNYSGFSSAMVLGLQSFMSNFAVQAGGGAPGGTRVALAQACDAACDALAPPTGLWSAWGGGLGGVGTLGAGSSNSLTYSQGGFAAGLDRLFAPGLRAGVTAGYLSGTQWAQGFTGQGTTNTVTAGLYGNYNAGAFYADGLAGYAYSSNNMVREISIPGLQRTAYGQTGANQFYGLLESGYRFELNGTIPTYGTPFARLQGSTATQNGFTESGAQSLDLTVASQTTNSLVSTLGTQFGTALEMGWREPLAMQIRLGWTHEFANTSRPVSAAFAAAPTVPFTTYGVSPQRDGALIGFAASTAIAKATSIYLRYEGNFTGSDNTHAFTGGVRMTW